MRSAPFTGILGDGTSAQEINVSLLAKYFVVLGIAMIVSGVGLAAYNYATNDPEPTTSAISNFYLLFISGPGVLILPIGLFLLNRRKPS